MRFTVSSPPHERRNFDDKYFSVQNEYTFESGLSGFKMTQIMRTSAAAVLVMAVIGAALHAQQPQSPPPPPVVFKVETAYVDVDAVVTDDQGNVVRGLTKDDFELFEDGKPQRIDMFTSV